MGALPVQRYMLAFAFCNGAMATAHPLFGWGHAHCGAPCLGVRTAGASQPTVVAWKCGTNCHQ